MRHLCSRCWGDLPLRGKALMVISFPLIVLLLSLILIYITELQTARAEEDVRRVLRVQGDIQTVHTLLAEAAGSVRGYLLTRREDFLPGYSTATPLVEAALSRLDSNVRDPRVRAQLTSITVLIKNKIDGLEDMIRDPSAKPEQINSILISNKHILDELRQHISSMLKMEDSLLAERTIAATETRQRLLLSTWFAAICGLFGAIVAVLFLSKTIVARVQDVQANAQRLALGKPLLPQPPENDEIGQLGARLIEAGLLLSERERALRENEERLRLIIDWVKDYGIFALDTTGRVTSWNAGAERIKGYSEQQIVGQHFSLFYLPQECPQHPDLALSEAVLHGHYMEEGWRCRQDGTRFWASVVITAQYDSNGELRGFSKITRDITDRRAAEIALRTAREEAKRASRAKSEFLSRMSHELRTPLNSILGFAQLLDMDSHPGQKTQTEHILHAGQHLLKLINEVLDIAKIEAGQLPVNIESIPLALALHEAYSLVSPLAANAGIQLTPLPTLATDIGIAADRQRLTQVLLNLLSNAIKYNQPQGQVRIDVNVRHERIAVSVCDTGKGIEADRLGLLFKPFERLGTDPNVEGSGLGLALSKNLLEMMKGNLHVSSQPGVGSRFTLELAYAHLQSPLADSCAAATDTHSMITPCTTAAVAKRGKMLCIEDNLASLALIETLLHRRPGIKLLSSMQGQLGLDLAVQHAPQLILLDVSLPDIDGIAVLQQLRKSLITRATPVLMITADTSLPTQLVLRDAGATAVLSKPIHVPSFLAHLDQYFPEPL